MTGARDRRPMPERCRFAPGDRGRVSQSSTTFIVVSVSSDGEIVTTDKDVDFVARFCERIDDVKKP